MTAPAWIADLEALHPCAEALEWARQYETLQEAWEACERPDWMLWWVEKTYGRDRIRPIADALIAALVRGYEHAISSSPERCRIIRAEWPTAPSIGGKPCS